LLSKALTYREEMLEADIEFQHSLANLKSTKSEAYGAEGVQIRRQALGVLFRRIKLSEKYEGALRAYSAALEGRIRALNRQLKKYQPRLER